MKKKKSKSSAQERWLDYMKSDARRRELKRLGYDTITLPDGRIEIPMGYASKAPPLD